MTKDLRSSRLLIERATDQIEALEKRLKELTPFRNMHQVNAKTGINSLYAEREEDEIDRASIQCSEVVQNLRNAIELGYRAVVVPHIEDPKKITHAKFPNSVDLAQLENRCRSCLAYNVSTQFVDCIKSLRPHGGEGGNRKLYFICRSNNQSKHEGFVPMGYYASWTVSQIREMIPNAMPFMNASSSFSFGQNRIDARWQGRPFDMHELIQNQVPSNGFIIRQIDIPVEIAFVANLSESDQLAVPTLEELVSTTQRTVDRLSQFS